MRAFVVDGVGVMSLAEGDFEQRVKDMEDLIADIPHLVTLRMETLVAVQRETSGRLDHLDRQIGVLMRDIRDMRGGVTRMLVEQDKRLARHDDRFTALEDRLTGVEVRLTGVEVRLTGVEVRLTGVEDRLTGVEAKVDDMNGKLDRIITRLN